MSGHSKWAQIKRQKGVADVKKGQVFTKMANAIAIAVKQGGGITDPNSNFKLRLAIDRARMFNMPKDSIMRAIQRAESKEGNMEEATYEGFAPGGGALIVEAVTDNKQRTVSEVKNTLEKGGGTFGVPGSVSYLFQKIGELIVNKNGKSMDELLSIGLDAGVEDVIDDQDAAIFFTHPTELFSAKEKLEKAGLSIESAEIVLRPLSLLMLSDRSEEEKVLGLIEKLEALDDVQKVYTNVNFSDDAIEQ